MKDSTIVTLALVAAGVWLLYEWFNQQTPAASIPVAVPTIPITTTEPATVTMPAPITTAVSSTPAIPSSQAQTPVTPVVAPLLPPNPVGGGTFYPSQTPCPPNTICPVGAVLSGGGAGQAGLPGVPSWWVN